MKRPPRILDTLVYIRKLREERARERLAAALKALEEARRDLQTVRDTRSSLFGELQPKELSGGDLRLLGEGMEGLFRETFRLEEKLKARSSEMESLKTELRRAYQERRVSERLRERLWWRYRREEERIFYRELDDLTLMRGSRSRRGR
ncbi:MAG TPA: hypothetical protein ENJ40_07185 [Thermosulfurimonas dismutans]|uniref:Flagellar FliJ protein n=1 Tax=Thermosulfurimonas dismutans TaxID=999894 RepID=A0A7C3GTH1_9BACT|nr:hypothetical protein [Thermosulfurimonas dismutans]